MKHHHGFIAYMTAVVVAACMPPIKPVRFDPAQQSYQPPYQKASRKKRGKRHGRGKR